MMNRRGRAFSIRLAICVVALVSGSCRWEGFPGGGRGSRTTSLTLQAEGLLDGWHGQPEVLEAARVRIDRAIAGDPDFAPAYVQRARYHIMGGYVSGSNYAPGALVRADEDLKKALSLDPELAEAYVLYGHLYENMGRWDLVRQALEKAERIGTDSPWLDENWAVLLLHDGKPAEAAKRHQAVIARGTKNKKALLSAYEGLAKYYTMTGDRAKANLTHAAMISIDPNDPWLHGNYAIFLLNVLGDYNGSISEARKALRIMPNRNAQTTLVLALYAKWAHLLVEEKNPDEAQKYFEEAHSMYPDLRSLAVYAAQHRQLWIIARAIQESHLIEGVADISRGSEPSPSGG